MRFRGLVFAFTLGLSTLTACSGSSTGGTSGGTGGTGGSGAGTTATTSSTGTGGAGGQGGVGTGGDGGSGGVVAFALTSTGFTEGAVIPDKYACNGQNVSPELTWTPGAAGVQSYAIVFTDKSNNLIHWVIWDIPSSVTSLPEDVKNMANPAIPAGSKQVKSYDNQTFGYLGPCPGETHTYEFVVYALDVATLPTVTTASTRNAVKAEILKHDLGEAALSGMFTP